MGGKKCEEDQGLIKLEEFSMNTADLGKTTWFLFEKLVSLTVGTAWSTQPVPGAHCASGTEEVRGSRNHVSH